MSNSAFVHNFVERSREYERLEDVGERTERSLEQPLVVCGWLRKKSPAIHRKYQARYFVLDPQSAALHYYAAERDIGTQPKGSIALAALISVRTGRGDTSLELDVGHRSYHLLAESAGVAMQWKKAIDAAREVAVTSKRGRTAVAATWGHPPPAKAEPDVPVTNTEVVRRKSFYRQPGDPSPLAAKTDPEKTHEGDDGPKTCAPARGCLRNSMLCTCLCLLPLYVASVLADSTMLRKIDCDPSVLLGVRPPFGDDLLPVNATLVHPASNWLSGWSHTRIDAYEAAGGAYLGYYYYWRAVGRAGFVDAEGRLWFEARPPALRLGSWANASYALQHLDVRKRTAQTFDLTRCDVESRHHPVYEVREDVSDAPWFCHDAAACDTQAFDISARPPSSVRPSRSVGRTVVASRRGESPGNAMGRGAAKGPTMWYVAIDDPWTNERVADAQQRPTQREGTKHWLSSYTQPAPEWAVRVRRKSNSLPNWVIGFMVLVADIRHSHRQWSWEGGNATATVCQAIPFACGYQ